MKKYLKLYFLFAKQIIRQELIYRASFLTGVIGQWLGYGATFLTLYIMVSRFGSLGGWKAEEITFLYAFNLLSYAMGACVCFNPCTKLPAKIRTGEFDAALTKPVNPFVHEILNGFNFGYIGHTILSIVVMVLSISQIDGFLTPANLVWFVVLLFSAALIQASIFIFSSAFSFTTVNENPVISILIGYIKNFMDYPITIYPAAIQILLTIVFPMAFMNFYPSSILLSAPSSPYFPSFVPYLTPLVGVALLFLSIKFWNHSLAKYQSSGT